MQAMRKVASKEKPPEFPQGVETISGHGGLEISSLRRLCSQAQSWGWVRSKRARQAKCRLGDAHRRPSPTAPNTNPRRTKRTPITCVDRPLRTMNSRSSKSLAGCINCGGGSPKTSLSTSRCGRAVRARESHSASTPMASKISAISRAGQDTRST